MYINFQKNCTPHCHHSYDPMAHCTFLLILKIYQRKSTFMLSDMTSDYNMCFVFNLSVSSSFLVPVSCCRFTLIEACMFQCSCI